MAGKVYTSTARILREVKSGMDGITERSARRALGFSGNYVPQPGKSRGYATGALKAIGYVSVPGKGDKEYERAVARAKSMARSEQMFSRAKFDLNNQVLPPYVPYAKPNSSIAAIDYPLDYAVPIESGFYNHWANRYIPGVYYLANGMADEQDNYFDEVKRLGKSLQYINAQIVTKQDKIDKALEAELRQGARESRAAERAQYDEFKSSQYPETFDRQRLGLKGGVSRSGRLLYYRETGPERRERIENLYEEWKKLRNSNG